MAGSSRLTLTALATACAAALLVPASASAVSFSGPTNFGAGEAPRSVAVGDFDADLDDDLAVANRNSNNVSILLGNGSGGFGAATNFGTGFAPSSVAVGNFDADANADLAVANTNSHNVSILLGNGTGGFTSPTNFGAGTAPTPVAVGDFNADSKPDLAVANTNSHNVSILLGNGTGGFTGPTNFGAGTNPNAVAVGNFDADANADLAVSNESSDNVSILLGNGSGGFGTATNFGVGAAPFSVAVGNFDADANADLAVANFQSNNVSILLGNGTGGFGAATNFGTGFAPNSVAVGNFDADANADLAVANFQSNNVSILLGNGTGAFTGPTNFGAGTRPTSVAVGNFDGDGMPDLAVANRNSNNVSILLGMAEPTISTSTTTTATIGSPISATATIADGESPGGTITFHAYGPDNASCSGAPAFTSSAVPVSGNNAYASPDFTPTQVGTYRWTASYSGDADNAPAASACNAPNSTSTVAKASPVLDADATDNGVVGQPISDTATLEFGYQLGGTITFRAYGPDDPTCTESPAFTSAPIPVSGDGEYDSGDFTPTQAGTYLWIPSYSGDANNEAVEYPCDGPDQTSVVAKATPILAGAADPTGTVGQPIADTATLEGFDPTGEIVFRAHGPDDPTCTEAPAFERTVEVDSGNGEYDSPEFTPTEAGTYSWTASYSGDANNEAVAGVCGNPDQTSVVAKATASLTVAATSATVGEPTSATATLADGFDPTGEVVFRAYGPDDETCSEPPAFTSAPVPVSGNGAYVSNDFTPTEAGTYRWTASYTGDGDNEPAESACDAPDAASTVAKATSATTISSSASSITAGEEVTLTATVDGFEPGGEVVFRNGAATLGSAPLDGSGRATLSTAALTVGSHEILARYAGDTNNESSESAPLALRVEARPVPPPPDCLQASPAPANYTPAQKLKTRQAPVPGVRARIAVTAPAQLEIDAQLRFKRNGRSRSADLGTHSLGNPGTRNLRLPLPNSLRRTLPLGTKVTLKLTIAASTGCGQPQLSERTIRTRVVKVLAG